jgi:hypothetical protein
MGTRVPWRHATGEVRVFGAAEKGARSERARQSDLVSRMSEPMPVVRSERPRRSAEEDTVPWTDPYVRNHGTQVRGAGRCAPGAWHELTILPSAGLVIRGFSSGRVTFDMDGGRTTPVPGVCGRVAVGRGPW